MPTQGWANGTYIAYASATGWHGLTSQLASTTFTVSNSSQASVAVSASAIYGGYLSLNGSAYFGPDAYWWGKYGTVYVQIKNVYNGSMFWAAFSSYSQSFPLSSIAPIYIGHYPPGAYKVYVSAAMPYYANYVTASASFNIAGASTPTPDPVILPTTPQSQNELASNDTNTDLNIVDECKKEAAKKASQGETNPVNLATGDKFLTEHDVRVGQISISRSYHSRSTHAGDMGYGWGWTYGWSLQSGQTSPEVTHIRRGDGKLMLFNASGNRLLEMTDETVTPSGGGWIYHAHDRSTVTFDASGHAISFAKENGQAITVTYDGSGNPTSITDHFGRTVLVTTDGQGRITSFSDPIGRTWAYGYDANNNLTMYSNPNSGTRQYGYTDADVHNLTSITNEAGILYAQYAYDVNDRAILSEHLYGNMHTIQYLADKTVVTDAAGVSRNHILATNTNIPRIASVDATTSGCGAINFDFTAEGNLSTAYDGNGIATQYVRNSSGDITTRLDAPGTTESRTWYYGYDALGRRTSVTLPDGGALVTTYDAAGRITSKVDQANKVESMQWNADSTLASVTDRNGNITQFSYLNGDPVSVTYPDGSVGTYAYDGAGRMTGMTDALGRTTSITLDGRDQATAISYPDGSQESFTYDPMGQLASHTDRAGLITSIQRNNEGFVTQVNYPDGSLLKNRIGLIGDIETRQVLGSNNMTALYDNFTYNEIHLPLTVTHADGSVSSIAYNANNKPVTLTDEAGSVTTLAYDNLGRTSSVTDPLNGQSLIQYDPVGRKSGFTDANGVPTSFAYNLTGTIASETSPDIGTVQYGYDNNGNTLFMTDARGITANFGYDNRNRLAAIAYPADTSRNVALTYDVANRVTGMLDVTGNTGFGYNAMDAVTSVRWTPAGSGSSITTGYGYDAAGRMASITYPSGRVVNYAYGTNGHVSSVSLGVTSLISNVGYHATGIMKSFARGNGELEFRNFDMRSRITSIDNRNLVWSPVSNITAITDVAVPTSNQALTYDLNSRLTDAAGSYGAINYAYDANANRTSKNAVSVPYVFGTNMVSSVVRDVAGNRASDASFQYGYAVNNRLAEVTDLVGTPIASYRHNALGQRQIKVVNGQTTYFVFDLNGRLLAEIDAATSDETDHVYNAGERIASIMPDGLILWHHNDHLGTPMSLVDAAGATVWEASYTPFGLATVNDDPDGNGVAVTNNLRFQGQYFDAETGLHYNYHRTYDPALGRYTQADPIGLNGGTNRFGYVGGNPVKYVDPLGLSGIALFARPVPIARIPTPRVGETKAQYERRIHDWSKQQRKGWREEVRKNPLERISKNDPFGYSVRLIDKFKKFLENLQDLDFFGMPPEIYVSPNGEYCDA